MLICFYFQRHSFKSCGQDSGNGGSDHDDSPKIAVASSKHSSLRLNNNSATLRRENLANATSNVINPFTVNFVSVSSFEGSK